ncbi:705_t:CDS:2 [Funneliformis mosseae]|uniref:705_t:CDS:1 n=1 Tax=Funneliformis mosseae TaxID=27381 RepID=A0A9N9FQ57_FUNMO|nr:705_t:CDS:2 [Funneliformis mosseae]
MTPIPFPITSSEDQVEIPLNLHSSSDESECSHRESNVSHPVNQSSIMMTPALEYSGFPLTTYSYCNLYDYYLPSPTDDVSFNNFSN